MTAYELALKANHANAAVDAAQAEVDRLTWLHQEQAGQMQNCIADCKQPRYVEVIDPACTFDKNLRCGCRKCNLWTSWTEWYNTVGYYKDLHRKDALQDELINAGLVLIAAKREAQRLNKEARAQALVETGLDA